MSKKVSVAKLCFQGKKVRHEASEAKRREMITNAMAERPLRKPLTRVRVRGPLTPREIRRDIQTALSEFPDDIRKACLRQRLTPLDRYLEDDEAFALECYARDEQDLGRMQVGRICERVSTSTRNRGVHSMRLMFLRRHAQIKTKMKPKDQKALNLLIRQMAGDKSITDDYAALQCGYRPRQGGVDLDRKDQRNATRYWFETLKRIAGHLKAFYDHEGSYETIRRLE